MNESRANRILVIDDDIEIRNLLRVALGKQGMSCELAESVSLALEKLDQDPYDVILLDLAMPEMDGFDLVSRLETSRPELIERTIIITGLSPSYWDGIDTSRFRKVLRKPFDIGVLVEEVQRCANGG